MKINFNMICQLLCTMAIGQAQENPQVPQLEIFLRIENNSGNTTTFYTLGESAIYENDSFLPTT